LRKVRLWGRAALAGCLPEGGIEELSDEDLALEAVMLGLRTDAGIDLDRIRSRYGRDLLAVNRTTIERAVDAGHLLLDEGRLRPTLSGMAIADSLARSMDVSTTGPRSS
jgi:oxygen-independent coproporphyrinogen-3 oxidase